MIPLDAGLALGADRQSQAALADCGPRRLWSLLDMLVQYAWQFFVLSQLLEQLHAELGVPLPKVFRKPTFTDYGSGSLGANKIAGLGSGFTDSPTGLAGLLSPLSGSSSFGPTSLSLYEPPLLVDAPDTLSANQCERIPGVLDQLRRCCDRIDLKLTNDINRAISHVKSVHPTRQQTKFHIEHITARAVDELKDQYFLHLNSAARQYYMQDALFGNAVDRKFPRVAEDISNAGNCFALGQYTAVVFHLMRVMEHCVQRFGRKLNVSIDVKNETWYQIMDHVNPAIKALRGGKNSTPRQNKRKEQYALAASRLDHVRIVWRNPVMHPKDTYDEQQALEVLTSVGAFLESISKLV